MTIPNDTLPPNEGVSLTPRQATEVFVAIARFDERIRNLIDTIRAERRDSDREFTALRSDITDLTKRVNRLETEEVAEKRSLSVWKWIVGVLIGLLTAAVTTDWFSSFFKH